jgi:hypothetical protein
MTEKIFTGEAKMMYPKQWIVMVELEDRSNPYAVFGIVHYVSPSEDDARKVLRSLRTSGEKGRAMIVEGWNDTPQIYSVE